MPKVTIKELYNLDGEYDLEMSFTHRDFRDIKRIAGVRANEIEEALNAGDIDVLTALAAIALRRAGKTFDVEQLLDAKAGNILLDLSDLEADDDSPPQISPEGSPPGNDGSNSPSGTPTSEPTVLYPANESQSPSGTPVQASSA